MMCGQRAIGAVHDVLVRLGERGENRVRISYDQQKSLAVELNAAICGVGWDCTLLHELEMPISSWPSEFAVTPVVLYFPKQ